MRQHKCRAQLCIVGNVDEISLLPDAYFSSFGSKEWLIELTNRPSEGEWISAYVFGGLDQEWTKVYQAAQGLGAHCESRASPQASL